MATSAKTPAPRTARRNNTDPDSTRREILQAALEVIAKDGPEGLSVTKVARRAGVNRGTAYQHFPTREDLAHATAAWVSERISKEFYGDIEELTRNHTVYPPELAQKRLGSFAMNNPELSRVWLFDVMTSGGVITDPFWKQFLDGLQDFVDRGYTRPQVDSEVYAFITVASTLLWPIWVGAHNKSAKERKQLQQRFHQEMMRLVLFGALAPDRYEELRKEFADSDRVSADESTA